MTDYLTEQEQIEILKNWIKQYSFIILAGLLVAIVGMSGWRYFQQRQSTLLSHASAVYDEMLIMRARNEPVATLVQAKKLFTHYPQTIYGQMAAFMLARDAIVKKDYPLAEKQFRWVLKHSRVASLKQIARLRLARLQLAEQKPQDTINTLSTIEDKNFVGFIDEVKGDAYLLMKNIKLARESYGLALKELPNAEVVRPILRMKYDNLATTTLS